MSNSNKKAFSKAPTALTALSLIVSLGMLAVLLLFQNGILFSLGFTDVTSDIIVMAITVALAVCAVLSLIAMVKCATANSHNKELVGSVAAKTVYRKDDSEQHNRHGDEKSSVAEKAQDEEVHEPAEKPKAAEEMPPNCTEQNSPVRRPWTIPQTQHQHLPNNQQKRRASSTRGGSFLLTRLPTEKQ